MQKLSFLTAGPSELYFTVEDHIRQSFKENIGSISHRSSQFQEIFAHTTAQLRQLMNIPASYHIVFTGSATEIWERVIQNLCAETSFHLVNGSFSKKFYECSLQLKRYGVKYKVADGEGFDVKDLAVPDASELLACTLNETSTGVTMPLQDLYALRQRYPEQLIAVDAVSIAPYSEIDFAQIDTLFFSVQKCFGLPAGLGVWVFNDRCVEKADQLLQKDFSLGTYHTIPSLLKMAQKNQTPETPNVLGIYLLGKVAEDMNRRGIQNIRNEINYKAALMYQTFEQHPDFELFVKKEKFRSKTVVVANVKKGTAADVIAAVKKEGIIIGKGYGELADQQVRIANFPTHSKETFEKLADIINAY